MKTKLFRYSSITILLALFLSIFTPWSLFPRFASATNFTTGNLVVVRVGDGSTALSSDASPVFLDEFTNRLMC